MIMKCGEYIGELFRARDIAHIEHLQSSNMAEHVVLEELYDALLDHVDSIAEMRLSRGPVPIKINSIPEKTDMIHYLKHELGPMTDKMKDHADVKGMNDISAEIDMIKTTISKKLYKLKNLADVSNAKAGEHEEHGESTLLRYKNKCGGGKMRCGGKATIKKR